MQRLGMFTGSRISDLMSEGRKGEPFGKTALSYIYEVAAERDLLPMYRSNEELFDIYNELTTVDNRYTRYGHENEDFAVERYELATGNKTEEVGFTTHPTIEWLGASPDRIATNKDGERKVVEVKCPIPANFMRYRSEIHDSATLKAVKPEYYWQIQAELAVTGLDKADFVVFCPFLRSGLHIVEIPRNDEEIRAIEKRVRLANEHIKNYII